MTRHTRRDMLRLACCSAAGASLVSGLSKLGLVSALAQGTTDYKALVCIFMFGGNDSNNMLVPTDSRYTQYLQARSVLALPQSHRCAARGQRLCEARSLPLDARRERGEALRSSRGETLRAAILHELRLQREGHSGFADANSIVNT